MAARIQVGITMWLLAAAALCGWAAAAAAEQQAAQPWALTLCQYNAEPAMLKVEWTSGTDPATAQQRSVQIGEQDAVFHLEPESFAVRREEVVGFELRSSSAQRGLSTFVVLLRAGSGADELLIGDVTQECSATIRQYFRDQLLSVGRSR